MVRNTLTCSLMTTIILVNSGLLLAQDRPSQVRADGLRTISVVGVAEEWMTPDVAKLTVGVETHRRTAAESVEANARQATDLMEVLKKQEIRQKDIQTSAIELTPAYDQPRTPGLVSNLTSSKIIGYQATNKIVITIRDTKKMGELLDHVVKAGVNQIESISFSVSDKKSMVRDLRKRALADAREKAEDAAKDSGMLRGNPVSIQIYDTDVSRDYAAMSSGAAEDVAVATPIAVGQEVVRVSVEVVYELKLPQ